MIKSGPRFETLKLVYSCTIDSRLINTRFHRRKNKLYTVESVREREKKD